MDVKSRFSWYELLLFTFSVALDKQTIQANKQTKWYFIPEALEATASSLDKPWLVLISIKVTELQLLESESKAQSWRKWFPFPPSPPTQLLHLSRLLLPGSYPSSSIPQQRSYSPLGRRLRAQGPAEPPNKRLAFRMSSSASLVFQHLRWGLRIAINNLPFFWNRSNYLNIKLLKISVSKLEQCSSGALPSLKSFPLQNCFSDPLILYLLLRGNDVYEPALWGCNSRKEMRAGRCNVRTQLKQLQLPRKYVYKKKIKWGQIKQQIHSEHPSIHPLNRIYCRFFCVHFLCFVTD